MHKFEIHIKSLLVIWAAIMSASCIREDITTPVPGSPKVSVELYTNAAAHAYPSARADEGTLSAPIVLVYSGEEGSEVFVEAAQSVALSATSAQVTVNESGLRSIFVVIANYSASSFLSGTTPVSYTEAGLTEALDGSSLSDLETRLRSVELLSPQTLRPLAATTDLIPMSGLSDPVSEIKSGVKIANGSNVMTLTRAMARASVEVAPGVAFDIKGIGAVNMARNGALYRYGSASYNGYNLTNYLAPGDSEIIALPANPATTDDIPLYLYETSADRKPAIIVKAETGGTTYYYKLGFWYNDDFQAVERNKNYVFNITSPARGYTTIDEALSAPPSTEGFDITVSDASGYDIISNGEYYLAVSNSNVVVYGEQTTLTDAFTITTDAYTGMGITTASMSASPGLTLTSGNTIQFASSSTAPAGITPVTVEMAAGTTSGTVNLRLGTLTHTITFRRENILDFTGRLELPYDDYVACEITERGTDDWLALSTADGNLITGGVALPSPRKLFITAEPNIIPGSTGAVRSGGEFYVTRGSTGASQGRTKVLVSQDFVTRTVPAMSMYGDSFIGAFWKAGQTGERLIRIPCMNTITGTWRAVVVDGTDWIKLDKRMTTDENIWNNGTGDFADMNTCDHLHQVSGNATSVTGTISTSGETMFFRIGLKSVYHPTPNAPARYGKVLVEYYENGNAPNVTVTIYVRQGEQPDHLMRPRDAAGPLSDVSWAGATSRPYAAKYSPYNLTAREYLDGTSGITDGILLEEHVSIAADRSNAAFTEYPSQAGAFFQWANSVKPRVAFHPLLPAAQRITGWELNEYPTRYWDTVGEIHETCPDGYRRPGDGPLDGPHGSPDISFSEQRQSLWLDPQVGQRTSITNTIWGYYADGFFDRGLIEDAISKDPEYYSMVAKGVHKVSYSGRLFYNPNNNASLFFPSQGYRYIESGTLFDAGYDTSYWTATGQNTTNAWQLLTFRGDPPYDSPWASQYGTTRGYGFSIRCVLDE